MKKILKSTVIGLVLASAMSLVQAQAPITAVDVSFTALTSSNDLQSTVDTLIANGANHHAVIAMAAAAGIPESKVRELQVCVNTVSDDVTVLSATCMRPKTLMTAYAAGLNDPLNYLPATAAGKRDDKITK
jgi:hypothetical protein